MQGRSSNLDLLVIVGLIALMLGIGTFSFSHLEGWSLIDSLYFSVSTITTIGYGDLVPTTDGSKLVMIGYGLVGISLVLFMVSKLMTREEQLVEQVISRLLRHRERSIEELEEQVKNEVSAHVKSEVKKHVQKEMEKQQN